MAEPTDRLLVELSGIEKTFGSVKALAGITLDVEHGECLGVVGHNGAGKSTLMGVLRGTVRCTAGSIKIDGSDVTSDYSVQRAYRLGVRCVFQEPSLCMDLKVYENVRLIHRDLRGFGWAARARRLIAEKLDEIFPGHSVSVSALTGDLPAAERQMVEIARAFTIVSAPARLIILDEPTSALDATIAEQFLTYIRHAAQAGQSCILISHRLKEIVSSTARVVVMRDGAVVSVDRSVDLHEDLIVQKMGVMAQMRERGPQQPAVGRTGALAARTDATPRVRVMPSRPGPIEFRAMAGEVIGLAGLDAHGQRETLLRIYDAARGVRDDVKVEGRVAYVSGDRFREGLFPLWSVGQNLTVSVLEKIAKRKVIGPQTESKLAERWRAELGIKTPSVTDPIVSLSGGNQQKVLIARALCSGADIIVLDDPMRGVDVNSKREMFQRIRREAEGGKCFLLYTTEFEELNSCDRVYVFYRNGITDEIGRSELSEDRVLRSSFADGHHRVSEPKSFEMVPEAR